MDEIIVIPDTNSLIDSESNIDSNTDIKVDTVQTPSDSELKYDIDSLNSYSSNSVLSSISGYNTIEEKVTLEDTESGVNKIEIDDFENMEKDVTHKELFESYNSDKRCCSEDEMKTSQEYIPEGDIIINQKQIISEEIIQKENNLEKVVTEEHINLEHSIKQVIENNKIINQEQINFDECIQQEDTENGIENHKVFISENTPEKKHLQETIQSPSQIISEKNIQQVNYREISSQAKIVLEDNVQDLHEEEDMISENKLISKECVQQEKIDEEMSNQELIHYEKYDQKTYVDDEILTADLIIPKKDVKQIIEMIIPEDQKTSKNGDQQIITKDYYPSQEIIQFEEFIQREIAIEELKSDSLTYPSQKETAEKNITIREQITLEKMNQQSDIEDSNLESVNRNYTDIKKEKFKKSPIINITNESKYPVVESNIEHIIKHTNTLSEGKRRKSTRMKSIEKKVNLASSFYEPKDKQVTSSSTDSEAELNESTLKRHEDDTVIDDNNKDVSKCEKHFNEDSINQNTNENVSEIENRDAESNSNIESGASNDHPRKYGSLINETIKSYGDGNDNQLYDNALKTNKMDIPIEYDSISSQKDIEKNLLKIEYMKNFNLHYIDPKNKYTDDDVSENYAKSPSSIELLNEQCSSSKYINKDTNLDTLSNLKVQTNVNGARNEINVNNMIIDEKEITAEEFQRKIEDVSKISILEAIAVAFHSRAPTSRDTSSAEISNEMLNSAVNDVFCQVLQKNSINENSKDKSLYPSVLDEIISHENPNILQSSDIDINSFPKSNDNLYNAEDSLNKCILSETTNVSQHLSQDETDVCETVVPITKLEPVSGIHNIAEKLINEITAVYKSDLVSESTNITTNKVKEITDENNKDQYSDVKLINREYYIPFKMINGDQNISNDEPNNDTKLENDTSTISENELMNSIAIAQENLKIVLQMDSLTENIDPARTNTDAKKIQFEPMANEDTEFEKTIDILASDISRNTDTLPVFYDISSFLDVPDDAFDGCVDLSNILEPKVNIHLLL